MKRHVLGKWLWVVVVCLLAGSCQQLPDELLAETEKGTLKVRTRSADDEEVVYPLTLYVFSSDGECVKTQQVEAEDDDVQLQLAEGKYRVVAVSACKEGYVSAAIEDWEDVIELTEEDGAKIPLVMGSADVTVDAETKGKLDIMLSHVVTAVDVSLSNIPSDVTEVVVTMSSFYAAVNLKGEYESADYSLHLPCSLDSEGRWNTDTRYLFPGSGKETVISIRMKMGDGEEVTYGYTWKESPEANQPYHLLGDYSGGFALNGSFLLKAWNEAKNIEFEFGADASSDEEEDTEDEGDADIDWSEEPETGEIWNGCIVANITETDNGGMELLLMSLDQWYELTSMVPDVLSGYSVNGIVGWRLPTREEADFLLKTYYGNERLALNRRIEEFGEEGLVGINGDGRYLFEDAGGYFTFVFDPGRVVWDAGLKTKYYIRLVKTYRIEG